MVRRMRAIPPCLLFALAACGPDAGSGPERAMTPDERAAIADAGAMIDDHRARLADEPQAPARQPREGKPQ